MSKQPYIFPAWIWLMTFVSFADSRVSIPCHQLLFRIYSLAFVDKKEIWKLSRYLFGRVIGLEFPGTFVYSWPNNIIIFIFLGKIPINKLWFSVATNICRLQDTVLETSGEELEQPLQKIGLCNSRKKSKVSRKLFRKPIMWMARFRFSAAMKEAEE